MNQFHTTNFNNEKANDIRTFVRRYKCDVFMAQESGINWDLMPKLGKLESMFRSENALYTISAHNKHRRNSRRQYGGTFGLAFGEAALKVKESFKDETGLGRWCGLKFVSRDNVVTCIITAYQPCQSSLEKAETVYTQHSEHFRRRHREECPR